MQLQKDRQRGWLTEEAYKMALKNVDWSTDRAFSNHVGKDKPQRRTKKKRKVLSSTERERRAPLRPLVKWMFDVEVVRTRTAMYSGTVENEDLVRAKFLPRANQCIDLLSGHPAIAAVENRSDLLQTIEELVYNRRRNFRNSRKAPKRPGSKPKKPLQTIYKTREKYEVYNLAGEIVDVPIPKLLPLKNVAKTNPPHVATPAVAKIPPARVAANQKTPPRVTKNSSSSRCEN